MVGPFGDSLSSSLHLFSRSTTLQWLLEVKSWTEKHPQNHPRLRSLERPACKADPWGRALGTGTWGRVPPFSGSNGSLYLKRPHDMIHAEHLLSPWEAGRGCLGGQASRISQQKPGVQSLYRASLVGKHFTLCCRDLWLDGLSWSSVAPGRRSLVFWTPSAHLSPKVWPGFLWLQQPTAMSRTVCCPGSSPTESPNLMASSTGGVEDPRAHQGAGNAASGPLTLSAPTPLPSLPWLLTPKALPDQHPGH